MPGGYQRSSSPPPPPPPPSSQPPPPPPPTKKIKPCGECSRLKLKCSRAPWPCQSCRQRNLSHLCPDGRLSTRPYKKRKTAAGNVVSATGFPRGGLPDESGTATALSSSSRPSSVEIEPEQTEVTEERGAYLPPSYVGNGHDDEEGGGEGEHEDQNRIPQSSAASPYGDAAQIDLPLSSHIHHHHRQGSSGIHFLAEHALSGSGPPPDWTSWKRTSEPVQFGILPSPGSRSSKGADPPPRPPPPRVPSYPRSPEAGPSTTSRTTTTPPTRSTTLPISRRASVDAGLLIENGQGNYSFYGPQSHSYNLAQLFANRPNPSLALPPLRRSNTDHPPMSSSTSREEARESIASLSSNTSPFHWTGSTSSTARSIAIVNYPMAMERALREKILDDPVAFIAMPGIPSPFGADLVVHQLRASLPPPSEARRAFTMYLRNVAWLYNPLPSLDPLWSEFYGPGSARHSPSTPPRPLRISLLFSVLCVGSLFDLGHHDSSRQAELEDLSDFYYQRAWAACLASNLTDSPCLEQVQIIQILGQYLCNRSNGSKADSFFPLIGMAMRTAVTLGLHRGSAVKGCRLSEEELQSRHQAFWELYAQDAFRSLAYGRPCSIQDAHVDTPFPNRHLAKTSLTNSFHHIKYDTARLLNRILDLGQRTQPPSYSDVLALDRSLRRLWGQLPAAFRSTGSKTLLHGAEHQQAQDAGGGGGDVADDEERSDGRDGSTFSEQGLENEVQVFLQGSTAIANISQSLLHLHRPWFVRALRSKKNGDRSKEFDLLDSPYARSVVAVSESSRSLIDVAQSMLDVAPTLSKTWNWPWLHCFNSAICRCLHTLQEPSSVSALGAWDDVRRAIVILRKARPDRSDVVWAGKLDLLEALQMKTEERLTNSEQPLEDGGLATFDSRRQSIAERHLPLLGGGHIGIARKRRGAEEAEVRGAKDVDEEGPKSREEQRRRGGGGGGAEESLSHTTSSLNPTSSLGTSTTLRDHQQTQTQTQILPSTQHNFPSPLSVTTAASNADEWLNALSDDLAGFLTGRQSISSSSTTPHHHAQNLLNNNNTNRRRMSTSSQQTNLNVAGWGETEMGSSSSSLPHAEGSSVVPPSLSLHLSPQTQAQAQTQQQRGLTSTIESQAQAQAQAQSWNTLLTDLLQVGCEPDANFWAAIAREGR